MLKSDSHSDVVELCRWADINPANYKRFESLLTSTPAEAPKAESSLLVARNQTLIAAAGEGPSSIGRADRTPLAVSLPALTQHSPLQRQLIALANVHSQATAEPTVLPVISAVGGCGVTTVLAALGRALCVLNERVLLVDSEGPSTLPAFYNAQSQGSGLLFSTNPLSRYEGQIHILRTAIETGTAAQAVSTRFHRAMAELAGRLDRVIVAGGESLMSALKGHESATKKPCLVIVTPELRSALAAPRILRSLGGDVEPWFLMNRFNHENGRHAQFRAQLQQSLGERLLPFCIPESSLVDDALSHCVSVVDLAPQSAIADAFFDLAEWYRTKTGADDSSVCASEETQLVVSN